jgi:hypothetical protein
MSRCAEHTRRHRAPCTSAYRKLDTECRHRRKVKMIRPARLPVTLSCRRYLLRHLHRRRHRLHVVLGPKRRVNAHRRRLLETLLLAGVAVPAPEHALLQALLLPGLRAPLRGWTDARMPSEALIKDSHAGWALTSKIIAKPSPAVIPWWAPQCRKRHT